MLLREHWSLPLPGATHRSLRSTTVFFQVPFLPLCSLWSQSAVDLFLFLGFLALLLCLLTFCLSSIFRHYDRSMGGCSVPNVLVWRSSCSGLCTLSSGYSASIIGSLISLDGGLPADGLRGISQVIAPLELNFTGWRLGMLDWRSA